MRALADLRELSGPAWRSLSKNAKEALVDWALAGWLYPRRLGRPSIPPERLLRAMLLQAFYDIEYLFSVPPGVFNPPPRVNSGVIRLKRNQVDKLECDEKLFFRVIKQGFGTRRKTLRNCLKSLGISEELSKDPIMDKRAEQLDVADFVFLTQEIEKGRGSN